MGSLSKLVNLNKSIQLPKCLPANDITSLVFIRIICFPVPQSFPCFSWGIPMMNIIPFLSDYISLYIDTCNFCSLYKCQINTSQINTNVETVCTSMIFYIFLYIYIFFNEILPNSQGRTAISRWGLHLTDLGCQPRSTVTRGTLPPTPGAETGLSP